MTDYILHVTSFRGLAPGAVHYRGQVKGPRPQSCHGGTRHGNWNLPEGDPRRGKTTCEKGHLIPGRVEWDVERPMTSDMIKRQR